MKSETMVILTRIYYPGRNNYIEIFAYKIVNNLDNQKEKKKKTHHNNSKNY